MRIRDVFIHLGLASFATMVLAASWTASGTVSNVWSHNGMHVIQTTIPNNSCGTSGKYWWYTSNPDAKDMFAIALVALSSDKKVSVIDIDSGETPNCIYGGQQIAYIRLDR